MPDDFDSILDSCLADIAAGRATIETCLRNYSAHAGRLVVLLETAEQAKTLLQPAHLPDDKRRVLESRLLRQAAQIRSRPASRPVVARRPVYRRGFAWLAASVVVVFLLISSAVGASAASVPGEFLYPVKRTTEQVRLALAPQEDQVDLHLEFARQRLQELQVVERRGEVSEELLTEISAETGLALDKIPTLPREKQREELASLTVFQDQHLQALEALAASAPGKMQAKVMAALADVTAKRQQALGLLAGTASDSGPANDSAGKPPSQASSTRPPALTDTAEPQEGIGATGTSRAGSQDPATGPKHTPPGQIKQATPHSPSGQIKQVTPRSPSPKPTKAPKK